MIETKKHTKTDEAWERLYARFERENLLAEPGNAFMAHRKVSLKWRAVAAAIAVGVFCCVAIWVIPGRRDEIRNFVTQENREAATLVKTLEDGSIVYLTQKSTLQYPEHFAGDRRQVNLQGEAFFDVTRKPEQTFLIETDKVRVEVLGTAFDVRSSGEIPFSLSVLRGKVKVLLKQDGQTVFVKAGETVTLQRRGLRLSATKHPEHFERYTKNIRFKDEYLENVLKVINKQSSDYQLEIASQTLGKRRLTVDFSNNSPQSVAELISWTFNLKCIKQGNKLILSEF